MINPKPVTIEDARATLAPGEALISTYVGHDRSYVWAVPKQGAVAFSAVDLGREELSDQVALLRGALEPDARTLGDIPEFDLAAAHDLYRRLLEPVKAGWGEAKSLLIVAHGPLGYLPMSILPTENVPLGLSELVSSSGRTQLKVAETEKYAHVSYFFNGGQETPFEGEDRALIPSPKVATYDLQPEMSARGVADAVVSGVRGGYDFILVNFANPDMVGHTGSVSAAVKAVEAVDACLADLLEAVRTQPDWVALITADHGNCEMMIDAEGNVHTAHTTEPVDFIVYDPRGSEVELSEDGRLADVAPTVLAYLGLDQPEVMTGRDLVADR